MIGLKYDKEKPDMTLVPKAAKVAIARAMEHGAKKYGRDNWKLVEENRYLAALMRHVDDLADGKIIDKDSGLPIIFHVAANAAFLCHFFDTKACKEQFDFDIMEIGGGK